MNYLTKEERDKVQKAIDWLDQAHLSGRMNKRQQLYLLLALPALARFLPTGPNKSVGALSYLLAHRFLPMGIPIRLQVVEAPEGVGPEDENWETEYCLKLPAWLTKRVMEWAGHQAMGDILLDEHAGWPEGPTKEDGG